MYKHCTTEESARRQRQIESCLMELMHTQDYQHITIGHICEKAGISRKSFYRYFSNKEGCLHALLDHYIVDSASFFFPDQQANESVQMILERLFFYWKNAAPLLDVLKKHNLSLELPARMIHYISQEDGRLAQYMGVTENAAEERITFLVSGIMGLVLAWHQKGFNKPIPQMAAILSELVDINSN